MGAFVLAAASPLDREQIYHIRHEIYGRELGQHSLSGDEKLSDALDEFNVYLVIRRGSDVAGFVSLTPPDRNYSLDKYRSREIYPFLYQDAWELRILTVPTAYRGLGLASPLLYAAGAYVRQQQGATILSIGRNVLMEYYRASGFVDTGEEIRSGQVLYHFMFTMPGELCSRTEKRAKESILSNRIQIDSSLSFI